MNCRKGDLARVAKSTVGENDKLLICLELHAAGYEGWDKSCGPIWEVNRNDLKGRNNNDIVYGLSSFPDCALRPIRGGEGEDESFSWCGKPEFANKTLLTEE